MPIENPPAPQKAFTGRKCLVAALIFTALLQVVIALRSPVIGKDGIGFIRYARALPTGAVAVMRMADQHPGYPAMILAAHPAAAWLTRGDPVASWTVAGLMVSGMFGLLTVLMVWLFVKRLFGPRAALLAAFIFAVLPLYRDNAADAMSDTPHLFFVALAAWAACEGLVRRKFWWFPLAGLSSGAAYLIRPEGLGIALVASAALAWCVIRRDLPLFHLACLAAVLGAATLVAAPYMAAKGTLTSKKDILSHILGKSEGPAPQPGRRQPDEFAALEDAREKAPPPSPGKRADAEDAHEESALHLGYRALRTAALRFLEACRYILALPLALGLFAAKDRRAPREIRPFAILGAALYCAVLFIPFWIGRYISERHCMVLLFLLMPWIGLGALFLVERIALLIPQYKAIPRRLGPEWAFLLLCLLLVAGMIPRTVRPEHKEFAAFLEAAKWLRQRAEPGDRVLSNSSYIPFYANLPGKNPMSKTSLPETQDAPGLEEYRFIVLDTREDHFRRKWITSLHPRFERISPESPTGTWSRVIVLRRAD